MQMNGLSLVVHHGVPPAGLGAKPVPPPNQ
jgi:hypothetical protein